MLLEQRERICQIVENISSLPNSKTIKGLRGQTDKPPRLSLLPIIETVNYPQLDAAGQIVSCQWSLYLFLREWGETNYIQRDAESMSILDVIAEAFLSRPKLQLNNSNLDYVRGSAFTNWRNLNKPVGYPIEAPTQFYSGAIGSLTVNYRNIVQHRALGV